MTVEAFVPSPVYVIAGTGPYEVTHGYRQGALKLAVWKDGILTKLTALDYTVSPTAADDGGTVTLSASVASVYAGGSLHISRETVPEQGFEGATSRERGLEEQLDWLTQGVQDADTRLDRTLRVPLGDTTELELPPALARALKTLMFDATGRPTVGTVQATELLVSAYVETLLSAADPAALVALLKDGFATAGTVTFQTLHAAFSKVIHPTAAQFDLQATNATDDQERTRFERTTTQYRRQTTNAAGTVAVNEFVEDLGAAGSTRKAWLLLGSEAFAVDANLLSVIGRMLETSGGTPGIRLRETDTATDHNQTWILQDGNSLIFQTRNSAGALVSTDYVMGKSMAGNVGADFHELRTNNQKRFYCDRDRFDFVTGSGGFQFLFNGTTDTLRPGSASAMDLGDAGRRWNQAWFAVAANVSSDARLKEDVADYTELDLAAARLIRGRTFRLKKSGKQTSGYVAQEIIGAFEQAGLPPEEAVQRAVQLGLIAQDEEGIWGVHYEIVNTLILTAILEQLEAQP